MILFVSVATKMPVKVSYNIELGPDLSNDVMNIARKQGEDPDRIVNDIQELRDMIFGNIIFVRFAFVMFLPLLTIYYCIAYTERGVCIPPRTDDEFLIRFLRARYFKLEHAYNLVWLIFAQLYLNNN